MKPRRKPAVIRRTPARELIDLRARLAERDETLRAIRGGEVDSVVVAGKLGHGSQVFTLQGAEHAYRVLIESMNEGALTLTADKMILYANQRFAQMVKYPLEQVLGSSFRRFLGPDDLAALRSLLNRSEKLGEKIQVLLNASDGSHLPAQISIRPLPRNSLDGATVGMVVTDMTDARRIEEMLRALANRVVHVQEAERGRVAIDLHDHITQLLCAILFRCQALVVELSARGGPSMREAMKLRDMLGSTAGEVERISGNLRPGVLDQLGLEALLRGTSVEFAERTGVAVTLACANLAIRLPGDAELALYRILQEALRNVEQHARASQVTVTLTTQGDSVQLKIQDDGIGFAPGRKPAGKKQKAGLGLFSMRERATYVGGTLKIESIRGGGTKIEASIPLAPGAVAAN